MSSEASGRRWRRALTLLAALVGGSPGLVVASEAVPWKPGGISSPQFESHAAFDPRTGDLYFVRSSPAFEGWRILVSHCTATGWSEPEAPAFAGNGVEADPYFTADGGSLYFISTRSPNGAPRKDLDVWRVDRDPKGVWGAPTRLPEPVNSSGAEWFPRPSPDGWLYFGSNRPGGLGGNDIWRARADAEGRWRAENLGPTVNTTGNEYEPLPSADGSRLIVMADGGLYETRNTPSGWSARLKLGSDVNANGTEIGALFSPSGRSLLFSRDTKGPDSGEFFVWHEGGAEAWPPECPPATPSPQAFPDFAVVRFLADESEIVTDTFWRDGAEWKMVASHASVVTHDPPEQPVSTNGWPGRGRYRLLPNGWTFIGAYDDLRGDLPAGVHDEAGQQAMQEQFNDERRAGMIADVTAAIVDAEGGRSERDPGRVWVFPIEVPEGTWGAAGTVWRLRDVAGFVFNDAEKGRAYAERTLGSREPKA